jgi:iron complex outermembrane receptor protein
MAKRSLVSRAAVLIISLIACAGAMPVEAQSAGSNTSAPAVDELETVVVTARRREENLQKVPISITALTQEQLDSRPSLDAGELDQLVPGLNSFSEQGIRNNLVFNIRGQEQSYGTQFPSVIPYFAEVPLDRVGTGFFYDLENLQVLKGPQGTLFGRNTDGGAILIVPKAPNNEFGGFAELKVGNYGLNEYTGAVNLPILADKILFRVAMDISRREGFTRDIDDGGRDLDNIHYDSFRGTLLLKPIAGLTNTTVFSYYGANENGTGVKLGYLNPAYLGAVFNLFGFPPAQVNSILAEAESNLARQNAIGPRNTFDDAIPFSRRIYKVLSNITTYDLTDSLTIKNVFGYINEQETQQTDFDGSSQAFINILGTAPFFSTERITDEVQLQGHSLDNHLTWVGGLYYDKSEPATYVDPTNVQELLVLRVNTPTQFFDKSKAAYAQGTYDLGSVLQGLTFTGGLRYTRDDVRQNVTQLLNGGCQPGFPAPDCTLDFGPTSFHAITYNVDLDYQLDSDTFLYIANRKGYKSGSFNVTFPSPNLALYQPEHLIDEEIGIKREWHFDSLQARTNADIFHGQYSDIQRTISIPVNGQAFTYVANIPSAVVQGLDLDATIIPLPGLEFDIKYTYTDSYYSKTVAGFDINNRFALTPRNQATLGAHYGWHMGAAGVVRAGGSYYFQSLVALVDEDKTEHIGDEAGYGLFGLDASWQKPFGAPFDLGFFMTNVTNRVYRSGTDDVDGALGIAANWYGPPRMFGFSFKYKLGGG